MPQFQTLAVLPDDLLPCHCREQESWATTAIEGRESSPCELVESSEKQTNQIETDIEKEFDYEKLAPEIMVAEKSYNPSSDWWCVFQSKPEGWEPGALMAWINALSWKSENQEP
jgi:hypothetical protein